MSVLNSVHGYLPAVIKVPVGVHLQLPHLLHLIQHLMHVELGHEELQTTVSVGLTAKRESCIVSNVYVFSIIVITILTTRKMLNIKSVSHRFESHAFLTWSGLCRRWTLDEIMAEILQLWNTKHSRWALCNESDEEVHVVDEGVVVGAGQVLGLMFVSSRGVVVHVDETVLHTGNISQILWQVLGIKGVFPILWRRCEDWWMEVTYKVSIWALKTFCLSIIWSPCWEASSFRLTWLQLIFRFEGLPLDVTQVLGGRAGEALVGQPHVLLSDGQGTVQTLTGQLKVIHGHLRSRHKRFYSYIQK